MLALRNIGQLVVVPPGPVGGRSMNTLPTIENAVLTIEAGRIRAFGPAGRCSIDGATEVIDADGGCVVPGLIDCHTHTVFAGSRSGEFVQRIEGKSYAQIAAEGGGIAVTVQAVRATSEADLVELALPRLRRMMAQGVTTVEIKSGYGLTVDDELKMLRAIKRLNERQPVELVATYLAAHAVPPEFRGRPDEYLDRVFGDKVLSQIARERLAEFCDVFCEVGAFDVSQSRRVLSRAAEHGLVPRVHADQITQMGASRLAAELRAVSADHLETIDEQSIRALRAAGTVAVLLPGCSFLLGVEQAPARTILDADLPVALATDLNPGSSMIESLPLVMSVACTQMRMTPAECLVACTANAAAALKRADRLGAIAEGMQADLAVLDVPDYRDWPYHVGRNCASTVIKAGAVVAGG